MICSNINKRLISYSLFSGVFLLHHENANAQVIYVDIEPDTIIDIPGEEYFLDILEDGTDDIQFFNSSFSFYMATPWWSYWTRQDIIAHLQHDQILVAGIKDVDFPSLTAYFPYAFNSGSIINDNLNFYNDEWQVMAIRTYFDSGSGVFDDGLWFPESGDILNKFLGFNIFDLSGNLHYGWIRCDVKDEGRTLIIKDYAYEVNPNNAIVAGDTTHYVSIYESENTLNSNIYSFGNSVFVNMEELIKDLEVRVYDVSGKKVYSDKITNQFAQIELSKFQGIYIVELLSPKGNYTKKIFLD